MNIHFQLTDSPDPTAREALVAGLRTYNEQHAGPLQATPLAVLLLGDDDQVVGGLWGRTYYGWLFTELLFVPEHLRGHDLGTQLMEQAEAAARQRGCQHAWLDTFGFQAKGFYEKLGYTVFGQLDDYPPGFARYFLRKAL